MDLKDIQPLMIAYYRRLESVNLNFKRYLYDKINWESSLIGIKGARGVGKSTMLLQHIKEGDRDKSMYLSLDNMWFADNSLSELVEFLYTRGINRLYLDEVHKMPNWQIYIKNFYDDYPDIKIVYTGSAMLQIDNSVADLSRRQTLYTLYGLSFREYLEYIGILSSQAISLTDIIENHIDYGLKITSSVRILQYFNEYLKKGYYPYFKEAGEDYLLRVSDSARTVIESDIPTVEKISFSSIEKLKKLLMVIAQGVPFEVNIERLAEQLKSTRDQTLKLLSLLGRAALLDILGEKIRDYKHLTGPKKIYLDNSNLMYALCGEVKKGTERETFFANQLEVISQDITIPKKGDFLIDGKYLFEVGGKRKTFEQIADIENSYLAVDDIEVGIGNRIPLWLFGFLY